MPIIKNRSLIINNICAVFFLYFALFYFFAPFFTIITILLKPTQKVKTYTKQMLGLRIAWAHTRMVT